jgi:hypothetical protein
MIQDDNNASLSELAGSTFRQQAQPGQQQQQARPQAQQEQAQQESPRWSLNANRLFAAPISRATGSEALTKLSKAMAKIYESANQAIELTLLSIDNGDDTALNFSVLVVCGRLKTQPDMVAFHTLLIEATGKKLTPVMENINNRQVEVLRVTGDAMNERLINKVSALVSKAFPNHRLFQTDGCVVPRHFNVEDNDSVHALAFNAGMAVSTELELQRNGFYDFNIAESKDDSSLQVNISFNNPAQLDAVGEPMRSDTIITFSSQSANQPRGADNLNSGDRESRVTEISVFHDVLWAPVHQQPNSFPGYQQQQMPQMGYPMTQKYVVRAVITNLISNLSYTPSGVLLALVTVMSLHDNNNWIQAFRPQPVSGSEIDIRDLGALNIEANLNNEPNGVGSRIDTKDPSFGLEQLGQYISMLIRPGLVVSMDVPECAPQTWFSSLLAASASGSRTAQGILYEAAQVLTNGNFGKYVTEGEGLFNDTNNRVHLGYWTDRSGARRDIRDIDHVAVANILGERQPSVVRTWSDTFTQTNYPLALRLEERKKIIMACTNETAEFTGFAQRLTFTTRFLEGLARGAIEAGLITNVITPMSSSEFNNQRGVAGFVDNTLLQPGTTFGTRTNGMAGGYAGGMNQRRFHW